MKKYYILQVTDPKGREITSLHLFTKKEKKAAQNLCALADPKVKNRYHFIKVTR